MNYTREDYINALCYCFGWEEKKAAANVKYRIKNGILHGINDLAQEYKHAIEEARQ